MARSPALSAATEQARLQQVIAAAGSGAKLWVYAGAQPAGPDTAAHGQTLLAGPYVFGATLGTASATAPATLTINCSGVAPVVPVVTGAPAWWRLTASGGGDGSAGIADGSASTSGTFDLVIPTMIAGRPVGIKSWRILAHETRVSAAIAAREAVDVLYSTVTFPQPAGTLVTNQRTGTQYTGTAAVWLAVNAAISGDTLLIAPETYGGGISITKSLTLKSTITGTRYTLDATGKPVNEACLGIDTNGVTVVVEDAEICNIKNDNYSYSGGIATRANGVNITARRCLIRENCNGFLGANTDTTGTTTFEDCEFRDNGTAATTSHHVYAAGATLTLRGCWIRNSRTAADYVALYGAGNGWRESWGHLIKSRARTTTVEACRLSMEVGSANRCIDIPNGGIATVRGCLMEMNSGNAQQYTGGSFITYGVEEIVGQNPIGLPAHSMHFEQNTLINHYTSNNEIYFLFVRTHFLVNGPPSPWSVKDNIFGGLRTGALTAYSGGVPPEGAVYEPSAVDNTVVTQANLTAYFPNHATYDFTPSGFAPGAQNWATYYYAHPTTRIARADFYRGGVPGGSVVNGVWTPIKDGGGTIIAASWAELPLNTIVEWAGTALQTQLTPPYGVAGGLTFTDYGNEGITAHFDDWVGMAFDDATGRFWCFGGGHAGSSNNMLTQFDASKGIWSIAIPPTANEYMPTAYKVTNKESYTSVTYPNGFTYGYFPSLETPQGDDKPTAMHTYSGTEYVNGTVVKVRQDANGYHGGQRYNHASVDASTPAWTPGGTSARVLWPPNTRACAYNGFLFWGQDGQADTGWWTVIKYNPATQQEVWSFGVPNGTPFEDNTFTTTTTTGRWFLGNGQRNSFAVVNLDTGAIVVSGSLSGRKPGFNTNYGGGPGACYVPELGKVVMLNTELNGVAAVGEWIEIDPATGVCATSAIADPYGKTPGLSANRSIHTRIRYWSTKKVLILHSRTMQNARVVRFG